MLLRSILILILGLILIVLSVGVFWKKAEIDDLKLKTECVKNFDYFFKTKIDSFEKVIKTGIYTKSTIEVDLNSLRRCSSKDSFELLQSLIEFENRAFEDNSKVTDTQISAIISKYNNFIEKK